MVSAVTVDSAFPKEGWKKNGTIFCRIRVTKGRRSKYIKTNILVHKDEFEKSGRINNSSVRLRIEQFIRAIEDTIGKLDPFTLSSMSLEQVMSYIQMSSGGNFRLPFFQFAEEVAETKRTSSTKSGYICAIRSLREFYGRDIDISEITSSKMRLWEQWLRDKHGARARAVTAYTAAIRHIHNLARARYNDEEIDFIPIKNTFAYYTPPVQLASKHRAVDDTIINQMIQIRASLAGRERLGVDVFLLSFALMGMNSPDLYSCSPAVDGILTYNRTKTKDRRFDRAEMCVKIDPLVANLAEEYADKTGRRAFNFYERYTTYQILGENVNAGLRAFCKRIGTDQQITLYSARHGWASIAYKAKVDKGVINDCLCHVDKDMKVTDIYIDKDWSVLWDANHRVLERFDWTT